MGTMTCAQYLTLLNVCDVPRIRLLLSMVVKDFQLDEIPGVKHHRRWHGNGKSLGSTGLDVNIGGERTARDSHLPVNALH